MVHNQTRVDLRVTNAARDIANTMQREHLSYTAARTIKIKKLRCVLAALKSKANGGITPRYKRPIYATAHDAWSLVLGIVERMPYGEMRSRLTQSQQCLFPLSPSGAYHATTPHSDSPVPACCQR